MSLDHTWITEAHGESGSAFSLKQVALLHEEQSRFQKIEVFQTAAWGNLMLLDGCTMVSARDSFIYHEMMTHPALYSHPAPERVAIIGGGDCGALREVLRHREVKCVTQIDIDERVTRVAQKYFPELFEAQHDPRAELLFADGFAWIEATDADSLDIIIVDSTDPVGPGEVLFTAKFYEACINALHDGGILIQQSESPLLHMLTIERMYENLYAAGCVDVKTLFFPLPIYPSGWWSATLGRKGLPIDGVRRPMPGEQAVAMRYYNADIHRSAFAAPEFFKQAVASWQSARA